MEIYKNTSVESLEGEIWKIIPGFHDKYQISSLGRVKSLARSDVHTKGYIVNYKEKFLSLKPGTQNYIRVPLKGEKDVRSKQYAVHRLVAQAFIPNPEDKPQVNHIDGNQSNNSVDNLEWCTALENIQHSWEIGLRKNVPEKIRGENGGRANFTEDQVLDIRRKYDSGHKQADLVREYNVSKACIQFICSRRTWAHI